MESSSFNPENQEHIGGFVDNQSLSENDELLTDEELAGIHGGRGINVGINLSGDIKKIGDGLNREGFRVGYDAANAAIKTVRKVGGFLKRNR